MGEADPNTGISISTVSAGLLHPDYRWHFLPGGYRSSWLRYSLLVFLEVLGLLEDLLVHFITIYRGILMLRQQNDQVDFQLGLDVVAAILVCVLGLVINDSLHRFRQDNQLVLRVFEVVLPGERFQNVVESLFFEIDAHVREGGHFVFECL